MSCLFLYNPKSGKGKIAKKLPLIKKRLRALYGEAEIVATESAEDLETRVREGAERHEIIVFSGGDGTFNHVLHGLNGRAVQLGYLPGGTTNDVARSLGIPRTVKGALRVLGKGRSASIDCMRVNDRYAVYIAGAGAFTRCTYVTPQTTKRRFGILAYAFECLKNEIRFPVFPLTVVCDGKREQTSAVLAFVLNGRSVASFPINKKGSMQDGSLEVVVIRQAERPNFFRRIGAYFSLASVFLFGIRIKKRDILFLHGSRVAVETAEDVVWDLDGEKGMNGGITVEVLPRHMRLMVPSKKKI